MAFYSYLSTKIIIAFITKSYQDLFGVRSYINAKISCYHHRLDLLIPDKDSELFRRQHYKIYPK